MYPYRKLSLYIIYPNLLTTNNRSDLPFCQFFLLFGPNRVILAWLSWQLSLKVISLQPTINSQPQPEKLIGLYFIVKKHLMKHFFRAILLFVWLLSGDFLKLLAGSRNPQLYASKIHSGVLPAHPRRA